MHGEHVLRRDVANGAVQTYVVVMLYTTLNRTKHFVIFNVTRNTPNVNERRNDFLCPLTARKSKFSVRFSSIHSNVHIIIYL
jgi:hypothetical protein